jgi:anaerobic selenocysteine-containing dehydrogenase
MAVALPTVDHRGVCPHDCPDTCGWVVSVDPATGKAVRMRGDADHPFTDGFLCQKVANYLERVYHPGRLTTPLKRIGRKGEGKFTPISWDEAIAEIATRFKQIAAGSHGPQAILPYSYAGTMGKLHYSSLDRRFFHRLGASLLDRTICATAGGVGSDITLGTRAVIDPATVERSRYIVNWGSNTKVTNVHLWAIMVRAQKAGAKVVTIDPHRSRTAAASDWWIPVRPGTDAALALGVMHVLFRDGLHDQDYLDRYCVGGAELRQRVMTEYDPATVSRITALPVETIEQLAHELGTASKFLGGPAFIRVNYGMQRHGGGAMAVRTVCCIPAVTGDWRQPGGGAMLSTSKLYPFDDAFLTRPDLIPPGTRIVNMTQLAEALHGELPGPPIQALYVYNSNPAAVCPDQSRVLKGLERDDLFTVVHDLFQTDTADYADIVLPATSQLEHFDIHNSYGHLYVQVNKPAIAPLGEAKPNTAVFRLLAKAMGFEDELFAMSDEELARTAFENEHGGFAGDGFRGIGFDHLLANGPIRLNVPHDWAPFANGGFPTPSGKCELYSAREAAAGRDPLPHYIPPHEDPQTKPDLAAEFPLQMLTPPTPSFLNSTFVNVDTLRQRAGEPVVEMNPADAHRRSIVDGTRVRVRNGRGSFRAKAVVGDTVRPGVVVSYGIWWNKHTEEGVNVNTITSTALTDQGGGATFYDNLVEVEAVEFA